MIWVVVIVTSILYLVIIKYEERVQNNIYLVIDDFDFFLDSLSFCSICSEGFIYRNYIVKIFLVDLCIFVSDMLIKKLFIFLKFFFVYVERIVID